MSDEQGERVTAICPGCLAVYAIDPATLGKKTRCPQCKTPFTLTSEQPSPTPPPAPSPAPASPPESPPPPASFPLPPELANKPKPAHYAMTLGVLAGVVLLLFFWCGGGCGRSGTTGDPRPGKGEIGYLEVKGQDTVWVPVDDKAMDESLAYSRAQNEAGIRQMMARGLILVCPKRTRVSVVESGFASSTIRILDGPHEGRTGVIENEFLHK